MTTREQIIAAAKECGYWSGQTIEMNDVGIERFYTIAFEAGRQAERASRNQDDGTIDWRGENEV